jgi:cytochrome c2
VSKYDRGPRAAEKPADDELAKAGEQFFKDKGCSACHAFGTKLSGPDLAGVTQRRTAAWMENQILHPEVMAKEDPISRGLMATHALQMPNQGLKADEARAVIEYLKHRDQEASGEAHEGAEEAAEEEGEGS